MSWQEWFSDDFHKTKKGFEKKNREEYAAAIAHLAEVKQALNMGVRPEQLVSELAFVHGGYRFGLLSIDESGAGKKTKPKALRIYFFPRPTDRIIYVFLIGEKKTQKKDVILCEQSIVGMPPAGH